MPNDPLRLRIKFTTASLAKHLVAPEDPKKPTTIYDTEITGFGAYRSSIRPGSFFVHYRVNRKQKKTIIARVNEINVVDARDEAARIKLAARQGVDVIAERKVEVEQNKTLGEAYEDYLQTLRRKKCSEKTFAGYDTNWRMSLSQHANIALRDISKSDIRRWHTKWGERGSTSANQTVKLFRAIFNQALRTTDGLPPNPCIAVDYFPVTKARPKVEWENLPDWLEKVSRLENPTRRCFWRFLLYSGLRRSDASSMRWEDVSNDWIHRPALKGGTAYSFDLPMSPQLKDIVEEARRVHEILFPESPYVFAAYSASGFISAPREKSFREISPHMLRRTFATACIEAGLDPYTTKRLLNHRVGGGDVTSLYVQPSQDHLLDKMAVVGAYIADKSDDAKLLLPAPCEQE